MIDEDKKQEIEYVKKAIKLLTEYMNSKDVSEIVLSDKSLTSNNDYGKRYHFGKAVNINTVNANTVKTKEFRIVMNVDIEEREFE